MRVCVSEKFVIEQYSTRDPRVRTDPFVEAGHELESKGLYASKTNIEWLVIQILVRVCEQFEYESSKP